MFLQTYGTLAGRPTRPLGQICGIPNVALIESDDFYQITAMLPGSSMRDIDVSLEDGMLTIACERRLEASEDRDDPYAENGCPGSFRCNICLPDDIDEGQVVGLFCDETLAMTIGRRTDW